MAYEGYVCFAGTELVNNARTATYSRAAGLPVAETAGPWLALSLGHAGYSSPDQDDAPWYDPAAPEAKAFCGLYGLELIGADGGTGSTSWTEFLGDGAVGGPLRRGPRDVQVRALALAVDDSGLSYGLAWLASALRGDMCGGTGDLVVYAAKPAPLPKAAVCDNRPPVYVPGEKEWGGDPVARGDQLVRRLFDVALLSGPSVSGRRRLASGGWVAEVTWTVRAGIPYWYRDAVLVASHTSSPPEPPDYWSGTVQNYDADAIWDECLGGAVADDALLDDPQAGVLLPDCEPPTPPPTPTPLADPCYPGGVYGSAVRTIIRTPAGATPHWLEAAPIVTVEPGDSPLRRLLVRWHHNPLNRPAGPDLDPCLVCSQVVVAYVPERSRLVLDGRTRQAVVEASGGRYASPVLYGPRGELFDWPVLDCTTSLYVEVVVDARWPPAPNARIEVSLAAREDAC